MSLGPRIVIASPDTTEVEQLSDWLRAEAIEPVPAASLAARIASRMTGHKSVVVFGRYDALTVFDRVVDALPAPERAGVRSAWREAVAADVAVLAEALETLLEGPLDAQPMLLIDDLERILEHRSPAAPPRAGALLATLGAICPPSTKQTTSRLSSPAATCSRPRRAGRPRPGLARIPCT
jgi:hypothetical protein